MADANLGRLRLVLWAAVVVAALGASVIYLTRGTDEAAASGIGGGTYSLVDHNGNTVDQTMLVGQPSLLFFGFTHCPDVCPTTMAEMQLWFQQLGEEADDLQGVFVSVDPLRDTPDVIKGYVSFVSDRMIGVTGAQEEIDKIVAAWRVLAEKVPLDGEDYTMNHTASVFLVNDQGEFEGTISYGETVEVAIDKIRKLVTNTAS